MSSTLAPAAARPVQLHRRAATPAVPAATDAPATPDPWPLDAVQALLDKPLLDLVFQAQTVHRAHWPALDIELATLLSVKTGGCPENCGYCPQAAQFDTGVIEVFGHLVPVDDPAHAQPDLALPGQSARIDAVFDLLRALPGGRQQLLALVRAQFGPFRVATNHQPLAWVVRRVDLQKIALVKQSRLQLTLLEQRAN